MSTNTVPYLTPAGRREVQLRLSLILSALEKSARSPEKDFKLMERKLAAELIGLWRKTYGEAIKAIFKAVPDFAAKKAADVLMSIFSDKLGEAFGSSKQMHGLMRDFITKSYSGGKSQWLIDKNSPMLSLPDKKAIDVLTRHNCFWIGQHYGNHVGPKIAQIAQKAIDDGMGRDALAQELRHELGGVAPEGYTYWDVVASSALVRARSFGTISGMEEAGITEYEIMAMNDERTCPICGEMDGTVFSVEETRRVIDKALSITDPEEFKAAMPWHTESPAGKSVGQLERDGQSLPPFHGRCRCTLVMTGSTLDENAVVSASRLELPPIMPEDSQKVAAAKVRAFRERGEEYRREYDGLEKQLRVVAGTGDADKFNKLYKQQRELKRLQEKLEKDLRHAKVAAAEKGVIFATKLAETLDKADVDAIIKLVKNAPEDSRKLWNLFEDKMLVVDKAEKKIQHYNEDERGIHINIMENRTPGNNLPPYTATFHELAHLIDHAVGQYSYFYSLDSSYNLYGALKAEVSGYVDSVFSELKTNAAKDGKPVKSVTKKDAYKKVENELSGLPKNITRVVSDTFSGVTLNKVNDGWRHPTSYWRDDPEGVCTEFFAEAFSSLIINPKAIELTKQYMPKSYSVFEKILKDIVAVTQK